MTWLNKLRYLIKEGLKNVFIHGFMSFASVTIIVACLIVIGSFTLLALNIDSLVDSLGDENQIIAYVDESLSAAETAMLKEEIEALDNVSKTEFMTRQQAMDNFASQYQDQNLFNDIDASVFRDRYIIYMEDLNFMEDTVVKLKRVDGIANINASLEIADGFLTVKNVISALSLLLLVVLVVVSIFITSNTIKLAAFSRREEIAIMRMVGATNSFIKFPFFVEGLFLGLIGGGIAYAAEYGLYTLVCQKILGSMIANFIQPIPFAALMYPLLAIYLGVGFIVGAFGGIVAIRNYLKV